jgi:hypothetical protein
MRGAKGEIQMQFSSRILPAFLVTVFCSSQFAWAMSTEQMGRIRSKLQESKQAKRGKTRSATAGWQARVDTAVTSARNLIGRKYDQTMGTDGGKNYTAGQIVCVDVPRLALLDAGVPMARVLEADARLHGDRYPIEKGRDNLPSHPIFARRTRNWLRWCKGNDRLLPPTATPKPGDVVFYGDTHISFITAVAPDGHYQVVECAPGPGLALEQYDWMVELRGWKATGFGRVFPLPAAYASLAVRPKTVVAKAIDPAHALENLQQNHPGLANLATILARLNGKPTPPMIVKVNGKPVMRFPGTTAASKAAAEAAGRAAGKSAARAITVATARATPALRLEARGSRLEERLASPVDSSQRSKLGAPGSSGTKTTSAAPVAAKATPARAAAATAKLVIAVPDIPADQKPYLLGIELAEAVVEPAPAPKPVEVAPAKAKTKAAKAKTAKAAAAKKSPAKGRKATTKHASKARKTIKAATGKAKASASRTTHAGQAD